MKRFFAILLSALMIVSMVGCGSKTETSTSTSGTQTETPAKTEKADYPTKTIQCIIPYAPGGGSDILTRAIMSVLQLPNDEVWAAINVEGAAGFTGCMQAFQSNNDGYTILAHNPMDVVSYTLSGTDTQEMYKNLEMICTVVADYNVFSTNKQSGWTSIEEVVEYAKANPGEIKMAVTGSTTVNYADALRLLRELGIDECVTLVPHNGGADCMTALLGNHVQLCLESSVDSRATIDSGDTIPLVTIGANRAQYLPDVPCTAELGYEVQTAKPRGYYAPAGTSADQIAVLAEAILAATQEQEFIDTCANLGLEIDFKYADEIQPSIETWAEQLIPVFEEMLQG